MYFEKVTSETSPYFVPCFLPPPVVSKGLKYTSPCLANKERLERFGVKLPDRIESASCGS